MNKNTKFIKPKCCICDIQVNLSNSLYNSFKPLNCLKKYGVNAHRICENCWFDKFAIEGISHICPGCIKKMPLTIHISNNTNNYEIIDIID